MKYNIIGVFMKVNLPFFLPINKIIQLEALNGCFNVYMTATAISKSMENYFWNGSKCDLSDLSYSDPMLSKARKETNKKNSSLSY